MTETDALKAFSRGLVIAAIRKNGRQAFRDAGMRSGLSMPAIDKLLDIESKAP